MNGTPAPLTPKALLERQLADWNALIQQLYDADEPSQAQLDYCATQIERIKAELTKLNESD